MDEKKNKLIHAFIFYVIPEDVLIQVLKTRYFEEWISTLDIHMGEDSNGCPHAFNKGGLTLFEDLIL